MEFGQSRKKKEKIAARIDREVASILAKCYEQAKKILSENKDKLELLAQSLLEQETLNRAEFVSLMETGTLPATNEGDKPRTTDEILRQDKEEDTVNEQPEPDDGTVPENDKTDETEKTVEETPV